MTGKLSPEPKKHLPTQILSLGDGLTHQTSTDKLIKKLNHFPTKQEKKSTEKLLYKHP